MDARKLLEALTTEERADVAAHIDDELIVEQARDRGMFALSMLPAVLNLLPTERQQQGELRGFVFEMLDYLEAHFQIAADVDPAALRRYELSQDLRESLRDLDDGPNAA